MIELWVRRWLVEAVKSQWAQTLAPPTDQPNLQSSHCDVGVVFALASERAGLEDRLDGVVHLRGEGFDAREGGLGGRRIVLVDAGMGQQAARRATELLIEGHQPRLVISAGFAGGLVDTLQRGDLVLADMLLSETGERLALTTQSEPPLAGASPRLHVGALLSIDRVLRTPEEKRAAAHGGAIAVDMESWSVAAACASAGITFLAARVVSDGPDDELPEMAERIARQKSLAGKLGAAFGQLQQGKQGWRSLWKLGEQSLEHSDRLAKFLVELIEALPATA